MSGQHRTALIAVVCLAAVVAMAGQSGTKRGKEAHLASVEPARHRHTEKIRGPISAAIEMQGARPEKAGDVFVLVGRIDTSSPLENVDFKWSLPSGEVELINGELSGRISHLNPGKPSEMRVTLKTLSGENHQIHLLAGAASGETRFAQSVQHNTLLEPVLEASRKEKRKTLAAEEEKKIRVMH